MQTTVLIERRSAPDWRAIAADVSAAINESYPPGAGRTPLVDELAGHVARGSTAWPLIVDYTPAETDRRQDFLSGPLYTSDARPWPADVNGQWAEPLLQIDLERWGALAGYDLGSGLLQLWEVDGNELVRVIPPDEFSDRPAPLPSKDAKDYISWMRSGDEFYTSRPDWLDRPGRIVGFGEPFFDVAPWHLRRSINIIVDPQYADEATEDPVLIERLCAILMGMGEPAGDDRHRAFGMCGGNVFQTSGDLYLPPVILTVEHDPHIFTNSGSTLCMCSELSGVLHRHTAHLFSE